MRTPFLALTVLTVLALTGVTVYTAGGALVGSSETATSTQTRSGGLGANPQGSGFLRGYDRLAKGDMSGTGGGAGGHKGAMKGGMKGGQHGKK